MTSFLDAIALDDRESTVAARKAAILAKQRVEQRFGSFIRQGGAEAYDHVAEDIDGVVIHACEEVGGGSPSTIAGTIEYAYKYANSDQPIVDIPARYPQHVTAHVAATIEAARMPKMCPFHKDVVDISLADGNARSGFEALRDHWGGARHCQGEGYEGHKCNFKPQMTTQAYWDDKAEKAEERKKQRAEQEALEQTVTPEAVEPEEEVTVEAPEPTTEPVTEDNVVEVDFSAEAPAEDVQEAPEVPMSMAASTKTADGTASPVMDKRKWTPQTVPFLDVDDDDGPHPTKRKDVVEPIKPANADKLEEIGEQVTEHQDVAEDSGPGPGAGTTTWTKGPATAVASTIPNDVDKNPITALVNGEYDGFLPQHTVQQAITASRRR